MSFASSELTRDGFLDGKLQILQPKQGYRAATDPVFLAAATPVKPKQSVLELGCGAGVALACLCSRVDDLRAFGVEIQSDYAELARENFSNNRIEGEIVTGDILDMPDQIKFVDFDHVIANPPYFGENSHTAPVDIGKTRAHLAKDGTTLNWVTAALKRLKPGGVLTMIHRADSLPDLLSGLQGKAGDINVLPISSRIDRPARRIIIQARKAAHGPLVLRAPLIVHNGPKHYDDRSDFSDIVTSILRGGAAMPIG